MGIRADAQCAEAFGEGLAVEGHERHRRIRVCEVAIQIGVQRTGDMRSRVQRRAERGHGTAGAIGMSALGRRVENPHVLIVDVLGEPGGVDEERVGRHRFGNPSELSCPATAEQPRSYAAKTHSTAFRSLDLGVSITGDLTLDTAVGLGAHTDCVIHVIPVRTLDIVRSRRPRTPSTYSKSEPGIRFNALEPGFTATDMTASAGMTGGPARRGKCANRRATRDDRTRRADRKRCRTRTGYSPPGEPGFEHCAAGLRWDMVFQRDVAPGIHRLEHAYTNQYLVEVDDRLVIVDAGLPRSYGPLVEAIHHLGHDVDVVSALIITHGHFDHVAPRDAWPSIGGSQYTSIVTTRGSPPTPTVTRIRTPPVSASRCATRRPGSY